MIEALAPDTMALWRTVARIESSFEERKLQLCLRGRAAVVEARPQRDGTLPTARQDGQVRSSGHWVEVDLDSLEVADVSDCHSLSTDRA